MLKHIIDSFCMLPCRLAYGRDSCTSKRIQLAIFHAALKGNLANIGQLHQRLHCVL